MKERVYNAKTLQPDLIEASTKKRHWELDFLRGLCVILMVIDHFFFHASSTLLSVWQFAGGKEFWRGLQQLAEIYWYNNAHTIAHYVVVSVFFLICGISCTLSKNNALRGVITLAAGLVITIGTYLADSFFNLGSLIIFGVIHMLGCSILLFSLIDLAGFGVQRLIRKLFKGGKTEKTATWIRNLLPMAVGIIGLIIFFALPMGHFGKTEGLVLKIDNEAVAFPPYTYLFSDVSASGSDRFLTFLSFFVKLKNFYPNSSDYFPIIPYGFLVLIGSGIGRLVYETKARDFSDYILIPPIGIVMLAISGVKRLIMLIRKKSTAEAGGFLIRVNLDKKWNKPVCLIGRRALIVYLLHVIIIVAFFFAAGGIFSIGN